MKKINPIIQHTAKEGREADNGLFVEFNVDTRNDFPGAPNFANSDTFVRLTTPDGEERLALIDDHHYHARTIHFQVVDKNWMEVGKDEDGLRKELRLDAENGNLAIIKFARRRGDLCLHLYSNGKQVDTEPRSVLSICDVMRTAQRFVRHFQLEEALEAAA